MNTYDSIIRGGTIYDGTGGTAFSGDIGITGGLITAIGRVEGRGAREIDANGLAVTPGFVDIHTHLDGHVTWSNHITPSSQHGVTTAVMGNCGVGFAPCRPGDRERLVALMEGVEDIPEPVLAAGLPWNWERFPTYLDSLAARKFDIDIAAQLPHTPLRVFVMGERAAQREAANQDDIVKMAALTREAIAAGAFGFATSQSLNHRASDGSHTPSIDATEAELAAIARAVGESGRGVIQMIWDFEDIDADFRKIARMGRESGRPMSMTVIQHPHAPRRWREVLERIDRLNAEGIVLRAQVCGRAIGMIGSFELTFCPFAFCPSYQALSALSFEQKMTQLRRPEIRGTIITEFAVPLEQRQAEIARAFASRTVDMRSTARNLTDLSKMYELSEPDYDPQKENCIIERAARAGVDPASLAYALLLRHGGRNMLYVPGSNFADKNLDAAEEMISHPHAVLGLSDAGAHSSLICDVSFSTFMLTHWVAKRGWDMGRMVKALSATPARTMGLADRGVLAPGMRADINLIDIGKLALHRPKVVYDLPAGGRRLTQDVDGFAMTLLRGEPSWMDGKPTGALPGRLVRSGPAAPLT